MVEAFSLLVPNQKGVKEEGGIVQKNNPLQTLRSSRRLRSLRALRKRVNDSRALSRVLRSVET